MDNYLNQRNEKKNLFNKCFSKSNILILLKLSLFIYFFQSLKYIKVNTLKNYILKNAHKNDRELWVNLSYKIASPVLEKMSKGLLKKKMITEYSPIFDDRDKNVLYMECFGRLMDGIIPWLSLPEDDTEEGKIRKQLHEWSLISYKNAVWTFPHPSSRVPAFPHPSAPETSWERFPE